MKVLLGDIRAYLRMIRAVPREYGHFWQGHIHEFLYLRESRRFDEAFRRHITFTWDFETDDQAILLDGKPFGDVLNFWATPKGVLGRQFFAALRSLGYQFPRLEGTRQ